MNFLIMNSVLIWNCHIIDFQCIFIFKTLKRFHFSLNSINNDYLLIKKNKNLSRKYTKITVSQMFSRLQMMACATSTIKPTPTKSVRLDGKFPASLSENNIHSTSHLSLAMWYVVSNFKQGRKLNSNLPVLLDASFACFITITN